MYGHAILLNFWVLSMFRTAAPLRTPQGGSVACIRDEWLPHSWRICEHPSPSQEPFCCPELTASPANFRHFFDYKTVIAHTKKN